MPLRRVAQMLSCLLLVVLCGSAFSAEADELKHGEGMQHGENVKDGEGMKDAENMQHSEGMQHDADRQQGDADAMHDHSLHDDPSHGDEEETAAADGMAGHHGHADYDVSALADVPSVELSVKPDAMKGWNVHIQVENFTFAPAMVNQATKDNEGHAHLYVDGDKVARVYSSWYHLDGLTPGAHVVTVTLNGNDHARLVLGDVPISDRKPLVQK